MDNLVKENNLFFMIKKVGLMNQKKAKNKTLTQKQFLAKKRGQATFFGRKKTASNRGHFLKMGPGPISDVPISHCPFS